jgi:hypothetical protein
MWVWGAALVLAIVCAAAWHFARPREADMSPVSRWWWAISEKGRPVFDDNGAEYRMAYRGGRFGPKRGLVGDAAAEVSAATSHWWGTAMKADLTVGTPEGHAVVKCRGEMPWWRRAIVWRAERGPNRGAEVQRWTAAEPRIESADV